jgi:type I restriction enzyme M protein
VFLEHIIELFGKDIPVALFVPMGFRLNQRRKSKRWRWLRDCGAKITSIMSLPLDIFEGVEFHNEIIIYNVAGLEPHYFLPEEYLDGDVQRSA